MGSTTNVQRRRSHSESARERAEQARRQRAVAMRRRRMFLVIGSAVGVLVVVGAIVGLAALRDPAGTSGSDRPVRTLAPVSVVDDVTQVPVTTTDAIGLGTVTAMPQRVGDPPLATDRPEVLYVGAEYCPYCAAERWSLVQALSRFGTFEHLSLTTSGHADVFPDTPTFTFYGAGYTSDYLTFVGRELNTNEPAAGGGYKDLETLTAEQSKVFRSHTNGFPFTDINGRYVVTGASYDPAVLHGLSAAQIAAALKDPSSDVAKAVLGAANTLTAAICDVTGGQPAAVCAAPGVTAAAAAQAK